MVVPYRRPLLCNDTKSADKRSSMILAGYLMLTIALTPINGFQRTTIRDRILSGRSCFKCPALAPRLPTDTRLFTALGESGTNSTTSEKPGFVEGLEIQSKLEFQLHSSMESIPNEAWDACLTEQASPFLLHDWLRCLEETKCASPQTGWVPQHVEIKLQGETIGYIPMYLKSHSMGEFIFDNAWADAASQSGINYYPKILVAVPFTPATGQRILFHPSVYEKYKNAEVRHLRMATGAFLKQLATNNGVSSIHCNFLTDDEATDLAGSLEDNMERHSLRHSVRSLLAGLTAAPDDYLRRTSLQYHWHNRNPSNDNVPYRDFADYLGMFKSKRRIQIKRERRMVHEDANVCIDVICGREILNIPGLVEQMFKIYKSTINKMSYWGRQYLTLEFFERVAASHFGNHLCFVCARHANSEATFKATDVFAGTFNIIKDGVFYGRYWGCLPGQEIKNLHFEVCYWSAIEYCIEHGLQRMEPGAGGGDFKWARGFDPALTHSVHYISHPGLRRGISQFIRYETADNTEVAEYLKWRRGGKQLEGAGETSRVDR